MPWFTHGPVDATFAETALDRVEGTAIVRATPERVFAALADVSTWPAWFLDMKAMAWTNGRGGVGAVRMATLVFGRFEERMIAWDPGARFMFSIDGSSLPLVKRAAEDWRLEEVVVDGRMATRVTWSLLADPTWITRVLRPLIAPLFRRMFRRSAAGLDTYLTAAAVQADLASGVTQPARTTVPVRA
jgi:uncharacterized protein YndB with AHSA1/START domain